MIFSALSCVARRARPACRDSAGNPGEFEDDSCISPPGVLLVPFSVSALKMLGYAWKWELYRFRRKRKLDSARGSTVPRGMLLAASASVGFFCCAGLFTGGMWALQTDPPKPVVVQPGAPGKPSRTLPAQTGATL